MLNLGQVFQSFYLTTVSGEQGDFNLSRCRENGSGLLLRGVQKGNQMVLHLHRRTEADHTLRIDRGIFLRQEMR